jgi:hypothetical protein
MPTAQITNPPAEKASKIQKANIVEIPINKFKITNKFQLSKFKTQTN